MLAAQHKEMVLETIDLLRQRKARPDFVRICRMVERKHGLTATETRTSLEALENEETVMKVHFKGNISYRHVKNFTVPRPPDAKVFDTSTRITQSLGQITKETGDGASFHDLEQWLVFKNPETRLVKNRLEVALQKEIDNGTVTRLSDDCFVLTECMPKEATIVKVDGPVKPPMKSPESKHGNVEESNGKGRPVSKRKKIRKEPISDSDAVFTPDEGKIGLPACDFCSLSAEYNLQGKPEALLTCKDCQAKAHPSCMAYSTTLASRARTSPWQCMDCKTCYVCDDSGNPDCMLFCDACDKGYHMSCHNPPLTTKPKGKWVCSRCKLDVKGVAGEKNGFIHTQKGVSGGSQSEKVSEDSNEDDEGLGVTRRGRKRKLPAKLRSSPSLPLKRTKSQQSSISSVPAATPTHDLPAKSSGQDRYLHENYIDVMAGSGGSTGSSTAGDTFDYEMKMACNGVVFNAPDDRKYPDATDWDMDEVVKFFQECGFKDQAKAFKEQEIDGRSLLLMKRSDVLSGLTLKLGPALKIYQKIVKLQTVRTES